MCIRDRESAYQEDSIDYGLDQDKVAEFLSSNDDAGQYEYEDSGNELPGYDYDHAYDGDMYGYELA